MGFPLRRHLANQHVAGLNFGADVNDSRFIQARQLRFTQRGDVAADFFRPQFGVTSHHREFFDVYRGKTVFGNHTFRNKDRVFVVIAVPRHESDEHVLTQREFAQVSRCTIGNDVALGQLIADTDDRTLVDIGVLVGTGVLDEVIDVHTDFTRQCFIVIDADHDATSVDVVNHAATTGNNGGTRVDSHGTFDTRANHRLFRRQAWYCLALHVGAHQCTVGVIVLQEGHQRGGDRDDLRRCHVHVLNLSRWLQQGFTLMAASHELVCEFSLGINTGVGLSDHILTLFNSRQIIDFRGDVTINHLTIRCFNEAVIVDAGIQRQRVDQTNVRAFRCFDRTHTTIMRRVNVTHFETSAFTRQTARAKSRYTALVGDFRQRVGLVHELRQLAGTEELLDRGRDWLGIDQVMRHQIVGLGLIQTFLNSTLDTGQAGTELVFRQFTD